VACIEVILNPTVEHKARTEFHGHVVILVCWFTAAGDLASNPVFMHSSERGKNMEFW
jgi:hypothetical protein